MEELRLETTEQSNLLTAPQLIAFGRFCCEANDICVMVGVDEGTVSCSRG